MDPRNGEVLALGSSPTFDPNIFAKPLTAARYKSLTSPANGSPLLDRAIRGTYPTGSTFKLISSVAGLQSGTFTPDTVIDDPGSIQIGGITFSNSGGTAHGAVSLREALQVSSDVFFYTLGARMNNSGSQALQKWAHKLGIGRPTGVDLPGEFQGLLPTPAWRDRLYRKHLTDRPWSVGDNVNLAVGQGDVQVDPLQLATAYATIANGGYVVKPHLGERVEDSSGRVIQEFRTPPRKHLPIQAAYRQAIMEGLRAAAGSPGGTSYPVFKGFPIPVAGKTGTAQKGAGRADQSWYVGMAPYPNPKYVVVATFESGGFGADTAAPAVRRIMATLFNVQNKASAPSNHTAGVNPYG